MHKNQMQTGELWGNVKGGVRQLEDDHPEEASYNFLLCSHHLGLSLTVSEGIGWIRLILRDMTRAEAGCGTRPMFEPKMKQPVVLD